MSSTTMQLRMAAALVGMTAVVLLPSASAQAADPPGCADAKVLHTVRRQYEMSEQTARPPRKLVELKNIREASLGRPPATANQYATVTTFVAISRYCEGGVQLDSGESDPIYWRIDQVKDGSGESLRTDHCSKRYDAFQDGCKWFRPNG